MNSGIPRLRMFAGPNGSGKSTFKSMIRKELLGIYVNPDDLEKEMKDLGFLDLAAYSVSRYRLFEKKAPMPSNTTFLVIQERLCGLSL